MLNKIKKILIKYRELILYGVFGLGATLINILVFYLFRQIMKTDMIISNIFAWIFAFIFAFVTNKVWVFESKGWKGRIAVKEMTSFLIARLVTLAVDMFFMWLLIDIMVVDDLVSKIVVNIIVIIMNYVASKLWVFKK